MATTPTAQTEDAPLAMVDHHHLDTDSVVSQISDPLSRSSSRYYGEGDTVATEDMTKSSEEDDGHPSVIVKKIVNTGEWFTARKQRRLNLDEWFEDEKQNRYEECLVSVESRKRKRDWEYLCDSELDDEEVPVGTEALVQVEMTIVGERTFKRRARNWVVASALPDDLDNWTDSDEHNFAMEVERFKVEEIVWRKKQHMKRHEAWYDEKFEEFDRRLEEEDEEEEKSTKTSESNLQSPKISDIKDPLLVDFYLYDGIESVISSESAVECSKKMYEDIDRNMEERGRRENWSVFQTMIAIGKAQAAFRRMEEKMSIARQARSNLSGQKRWQQSFGETEREIGWWSRSEL
ncbi:expressed unknown protein [Seminavis robusta]|uniref:Uncharacterized protein n=1 Tax=Seminavis robusta TaxID=568900 RepID=A0A9N8HEW0_9STRA|nr:expressed unknown protein [Seminavis robusta]|eukprot:Sro492_g153970.1 n/a (348) ;mRNA; r:57902-58945